MKMDIVVLNVMKYEKEGTEKSRLGYFIADTTGYSNSDKFRGYSELSAYSNDTRYFDKIPMNFIGQKCTCEIAEVPYPNNPMKSRKEIQTITCENETIRLV